MVKRAVIAFVVTIMLGEHIQAKPIESKVTDTVTEVDTVLTSELSVGESIRRTMVVASAPESIDHIDEEVSVSGFITV